jgi:hypothetical protein
MLLNMLNSATYNILHKITKSSLIVRINNFNRTYVYHTNNKNIGNFTKILNVIFSFYHKLPIKYDIP